MRHLPLRLEPGCDLRAALEAVVRERRMGGAFVVCGIGSLDGAQLRFAGAELPTALKGELEMLTLSGSISIDGAHLHMAVADANGQVLGGHVAAGCRVRTTAEVLLVPLDDWTLAREADPGTGYRELVIRARQAP